MSYAQRLQPNNETVPTPTAAEIQSDLQSSLNSLWHHSRNHAYPAQLRNLGSTILALVSTALPDMTAAEKEILKKLSFSVDYGVSGVTTDGKRCPTARETGKKITTRPGIIMAELARDAQGNIITEPFNDMVTLSYPDYSKYSLSTEADIAARKALFEKLANTIGGKTTLRLPDPSEVNRIPRGEGVDKTISLTLPLEDLARFLTSLPASALDKVPAPSLSR